MLTAFIVAAGSSTSPALSTALIDRPQSKTFFMWGGHALCSAARCDQAYDDIDFDYDVLLTKFSWWGNHIFSMDGTPAPAGDPVPGSMTLAIRAVDIMANGEARPGKIIYTTDNSPKRTSGVQRPGHDMYTYDLGAGVRLNKGEMYLVSITSPTQFVWGYSDSVDYKGWYDRACIEAKFASACTLDHMPGGRRTNNRNMAVRYEGVRVPEPATWAMLIIGMGLNGLALRSRRRVSDAGAGKAC